ncbi:zinc finger protein zat2 [Phtheirospermum japonicum]|uniref:Zinc finger protein zat2 n=1 Tax=Phtheirospermum japonicum TaxID=374723 RepID=A0A830BCP2_9LAMI|nr:zinc finger protein zat2 [Phtheirospermum japonicum]
MFQCKACKKIFNSHQALGGHRASHKKVKGCFAAKLDGGDEEIDPVQEEREPAIPSGSDPARSASTSKRPKMHECSVCRRVFSSGQALGGHKRCHWLTTSSSTTTDNAFIPSFQDFQYDHQQQLCTKPMFMKPRDEQDHQLDLNLNLPVVDNTSRFEASTRLYLQQQRIPNTNANANTNTNTGNDNGQMGREVNKIRKLSDLRDVNYDGGWLQMGIASTADIY